MKANITIEMASDGGFGATMKEEIPGMILTGYGTSAEEAKNDLLASYEEMSQMLRDEGKEPVVLDFVYHYDMKSFFNYFSFLNVSKVAERAGINPSLMRKYASGLVKARQPQYDKLKAAIGDFTRELQAAAF